MPPCFRPASVRRAVEATIRALAANHDAPHFDAAPASKTAAAAARRYLRHRGHEHRMAPDNRSGEE